MLKIIKWYTTICVMIILLSGEMLQAMPGPGKEQLQRQQSDIFTLDLAVKDKKYERFNWVNLYPYFIPDINDKDFIEVTKNDENIQTTIDALAQLIVEKHLFTTETLMDAKLYIYSVFNSFYHYCIDNDLLRLTGFQLLSDIYAQGCRLSRIEYRLLKDNDDSCIAQISELYIKNFIDHPDINKIELVNSLSDLTVVIYRYLKLTALDIPSGKNQVKLTVKDFLEYYPATEREKVFIFLINDLLKTEEVPASAEMIQKNKNKNLKVETKLQEEVAVIFKQLWINNQEVSDREQLAKLATRVFQFNALRSHSS